MERVAAFVALLPLFCPLTDGNQRGNSSRVMEAAVLVDLSAATRRVDRRFLSVTIDASLAAEEKFMYLLGWVSVCLSLSLSPASC